MKCLNILLLNQCSLLLRRGDSAYASQLLTHARSMFQFADEHRGVYTDAIPAQDFYAVSDIHETLDIVSIIDIFAVLEWL